MASKARTSALKPTQGTAPGGGHELLQLDGGAEQRLQLQRESGGIVARREARGVKKVGMTSNKRENRLRWYQTSIETGLR